MTNLGNPQLGPPRFYGSTPLHCPESIPGGVKAHKQFISHLRTNDQEERDELRWPTQRDRVQRQCLCVRRRCQESDLARWTAKRLKVSGLGRKMDRTWPVPIWEGPNWDVCSGYDDSDDCRRPIRRSDRELDRNNLLTMWSER